MKMSSIKGNIIHRRQFQNANQIITVDVKSKPKVASKPKVIHNTFKRNCALRNEIDKVKKVRNEIDKVKKASPKTKSNKQKEKISAAGNVTWMEFLVANNILPQGDITNSLVDKESSIGSFSGKKISAVPVNRKQIPIPKHLSHATRQKDISLQCDRSLETETVPARYLYPNVNSSKAGAPIAKLKNIPSKSTPVTKNQQQPRSSSTDQTHTPFGESALQLINQLREHLRCRGDLESSDLVNQIATCIGGGIGSGNMLSDAKDNVFKFPSVPQENTPKDVSPTVKNNDQVIVENEKLRLQNENLEKANQELREISGKLLEYHQNMAKYEPSENSPSTDDVPVKLSNKENIEAAPADPENRMLRLERDELLERVTYLKNVMYNLEAELDKNRVELKKAKMESKLILAGKGTSVTEVDSNQNLGRSPIWNRPDIRSQLSMKPPIRSDTDSAFDDRSVSLSESKRTSPSVMAPDQEVPRPSISRRVVGVPPGVEQLSLTRWSNFTDDEAANVVIQKVFPGEVASKTNQHKAANRGKVMESTRISSDHVSPQASILSEIDLSREELHCLQAEFTNT